jgi:hypothetical protein
VDDSADNGGAAAEPATPSTVRRLDGPEAAELAGLTAVFEDLQHVLRCCEHLVGALGTPHPDPALVEALWTSALLGYTRCFSARTALLADADLERLDLGEVDQADVAGFHQTLRTLRDHYASRHINPRETFAVGAAQANDGRPTGVAVVSTPRPEVDDPTVRLLGRVAYGLSGLLDARMQEAQEKVLAAAAALTPAALSQLPLVHLSQS